MNQALLLKGTHAGKMAPAYTLRYQFMKFSFITTYTVELVNYTCLKQMQQFLFAAVTHIMQKIFLEMSPN
jgi:hypothetical protein